MVSEKLGVKQTCPNCAAKFYDLGREPAVCPKCEHSFVPEQLMPRGRSGSKQNANGAAAAAAAEKEAAPEETSKQAEKSEPVVTFEEADAEASDVKRSGAPAMDDEEGMDVEVDVDIDMEDDDEDDSGLLPDDDDFEDDVSGMIDTDIDEES